MMTVEEAERFAAQWIAAWNAHDLDGILAHYTEDVEARSPMISRLTEESSGVIRGKTALRKYFSRGLKNYPDLRFEPLEVFLGADGVGIHYKGVGGLRVVECFRLDEDERVTHVSVYYHASGGAAPSGDADHDPAPSHGGEPRP